MGRIRVLESWLADRIAAGEVVERPASVVKELVENALDALARSVTVEVERGGFDLVRVADDGVGMDPADAVLALRRFATSKIASRDDLRGIATLGFRGEALPSIAAVSQVDIVTSDGHAATRVRAEGGGTPSVEPAAAPRGTVVAVRRLFYNTPARRAFLRSVGREAALCADAVERHALARPDVAFRFVRDGEEVLRLPPATPLERAATVLGIGAKHLLPIDRASGALRIEGFLGVPSAARRSRSGQYVFVNRRPVHSPLVARAIEQGSRTHVLAGHHAICALFVTLPPASVDPNVHPRKLEVRFADEDAVFRAVESAVRDAFRSRSPSGLDVVVVGVRPYPRNDPPTGEIHESTAAALPLPTPPRCLPPLEVLGQVAAAYVVAAAPGGLALIDQHAAHERVLYERFLRARSREAHAQTLAAPLVLDLPPSEATLLEGALDAFRQIGFDIEPFGGTFLVREVPAPVGGSPDVLIREVLAELRTGQPAASPRHAIQRVAILAACHSAVRAGDVLSHEEMTALVEELGRCEDPYTCFHGRPTLVIVPRERLDTWFLRR
ncbi:MAG: DNA mismatch repair endonuclease MutL [Armatimonadota bacterium]|nr:DNA mismatch repair endonuclease MutL [Armatimonadota bacterium]